MPDAPLLALADASLPGFALLVFVLMFAAMEVAYRVGLRCADDGEGVRTTTGIVTGSMLALFAFLLTIMFSMAAERYEKRRQSVLDEANALGTAWLRAELLGAGPGAVLRGQLRDYAPLRIAALRGEADWPRIGAMQDTIWRGAAAAAMAVPGPLAAQSLSALNQVFDLATTSRRNARHGVPPHVLRLVLAVAMLSAAAMGFQFGLHRHRQLWVILLLLMTWSVGMVLVVDIDSAGSGSVRIDPAPMVWTVESWGAR